MAVTIPPLTTSTNLGPMTTPLSFPSDCLSNLYDFNSNGLGLPWTYETQGCALSTCCPSGNFYTEGFAWLTSYYSPAVCPVSYKICPLPTQYTDWSSANGESIALCCPNDYECAGGSNAICQSLLATSTNVVVINNIFDQQTVSTRPWTLGQSMQAAGISSNQIAYPLQIRWKEGDFAPATATKTSGASTTGAGTGATETGAQLSSSPAAQSGSSKSSSALSTGGLAGIITGVISAVVGVAGLAFRIYKWKHPKTPPVVYGSVGDPQKTTAHA